MENNQWKFQIDQGKYQIISIEEDPHAITGLLKLFFRELKTPLLSVRDLNYAKFDLKLYSKKLLFLIVILLLILTIYSANFRE